MSLLDLAFIYDKLAAVIGEFGAGFVTAGAVAATLVFAVKRARLPDTTVLTPGAVAYNAEAGEYQALRRRVAAGGVVGPGYENRLRAGLQAVDRFFHEDPGARPSPTWTAPSMDRCLLLAVAYPFFALLAGWWIYGQPGPVAAELGFPSDAPGGSRALHAASLAFVVAVSLWLIAPPRAHQTPTWRLIRSAALPAAISSVVVFGGAVSGAVSGAVAVSVAGVVAVAVRRAFSGAVVGAGVGAFSFVFAFAFAVSVASAVSGSVALALAGAGPIAAALLGAGAIAAVLAIVVTVLAHHLNAKRPGLGWAVYFPILLFAAPALVVLSPRLLEFETEPVWTLVLMLWALPLINAVFDWVSLGFTRYLLKTGLSRGGWWPAGFALVDAAMAVGVLFILMIATLAYIQVLNIAAAPGGFAPVLDVAAVLALLRADPGAPALWWIYITVFTTFIPSLVNLTLGGLSLVRGIPGLNALLVERWMTADLAGFTAWRRNAAAFGMTVQWMTAGLGAFLVGVGVIGVIFTGLDVIGLGLIEVAERVNGRLDARRRRARRCGASRTRRPFALAQGPNHAGRPAPPPGAARGRGHA